MRTLVVTVVSAAISGALGLVPGHAVASDRAAVTVLLYRGGYETLPGYGGSELQWQQLAGCVRSQFAAYNVDIVEQIPTSGRFITASVGGRVEDIGGTPPTAGLAFIDEQGVDEDAPVFVFSQSVGERDIRELCRVAAHEIGHALGLDHSMSCDVMGYPSRACDRELRVFLDVDARCGEYEARDCSHGTPTQNSHQRLAALVGLRVLRGPAESEPEPNPEPEPETGDFVGDDQTTEDTEDAYNHDGVNAPVFEAEPVKPDSDRTFDPDAHEHANEPAFDPQGGERPNAPRRSLCGRSGGHASHGAQAWPRTWTRATSRDELVRRAARRHMRRAALSSRMSGAAAAR